MAVPKICRLAENIKPGDLIEISMEKDLEKRTVEISKNLFEALQKADLTETFAKMSFIHQKE